METSNTQQPTRVGFGPRLGAYLIDVLIAGIVGGILGSVLGASITGLFFATSSVGGEEADMAAGALAGLFGAIAGMMGGFYLVFLIIMFMEAFTGQSFGKMVLKLKVAQEDGAAAETSVFVKRALIKYSGTVLGVLAGVTGMLFLSPIASLAGLAIFIGCFFVLGEKRQAFQDMLAKTAIYKTSDIK
jgi:uncharacterized RDD family membrane protein YckC